MNKYEELIAILRDEDNPNVLDYIDEAADAIEKLQEYEDTGLEPEEIIELKYRMESLEK